jgi:hypothetical protein
LAHLHILQMQIEMTQFYVYREMLAHN